MSGYYENKMQNGCAESAYVTQNNNRYNYVVNPSFHMRPGVSICNSKAPALGVSCSFFGPRDVKKTRQESLLQGRGQSLNSHCPAAGVIVLPDSEFPQVPSNEQIYGENLSELQPEYTRQPLSCFNLSESESTYALSLPGAFQTGYTGLGDFIDRPSSLQGQQQQQQGNARPCNSTGYPYGYHKNIDSRLAAADEFRQVPQFGAGPSRTSYGSYESMNCLAKQ